MYPTCMSIIFLPLFSVVSMLLTYIRGAWYSATEFYVYYRYIVYTLCDCGGFETNAVAGQRVFMGLLYDEESWAVCLYSGYTD